MKINVPKDQYVMKNVYYTYNWYYNGTLSSILYAWQLQAKQNEQLFFILYYINTHYILYIYRQHCLIPWTFFPFPYESDSFVCLFFCHSFSSFSLAVCFSTACILLFDQCWMVFFFFSYSINCYLISAIFQQQQTKSNKW